MSLVAYKVEELEVFGLYAVLTLSDTCPYGGLGEERRMCAIYMGDAK